jgi:hypothetical protein
MIKATELRIGIWVNYYGKPQLIDSPETLMEALKSLDQGAVTGIVITPDWLTRLEFEMSKQEYTVTYRNWPLVVIFEKTTLLSDIPTIRVAGSREAWQVDHIHQLQNLYHALTTDELKIQKHANGAGVTPRERG